MHFQNILAQVASFFLLSQMLVYALPAEHAILDPRAIEPCDGLSKYTVEVSHSFLDTIKMGLADPYFTAVV